MADSEGPTSRTCRSSGRLNGIGRHETRGPMVRGAPAPHLRRRCSLRSVPMDSRIVRLTTIWLDRLPNNVWVEIETADGRVGLGESYGTPESLTAWLHEIAAPALIGQDADQIERHWWALYTAWGQPGVGVEGRGISLVD